MLTNIPRLALFAVATALHAPLLTSCHDIDHATTIFPDGSGRFVLTLRIKSEDSKQDIPADQFLAGFVTQTEGFTAWAEPSMRRAEEQGRTVLTFILTGYFLDVSAVRLSDEDMKPGAPRERWDLWFELLRTDKERVLTVHDRRIAQYQRQASRLVDPESTCGDDDAYIGAVTVPGSITEARGYHDVRGRTASFRIDDKVVFLASKGDPGANEKVNALSAKATIRWKEDSVPKAEVEAFWKEYAQAAAAWKGLKVRLVKIQERVKREKRGDH